MKLHQVAMAIAATLALGVAQADTFTLTGTLSLTDATFNRPLTLTSLSGVGTAVHYDVFTFSGVEPGLYSFLSTSTGFDNYTLLYAGTFNAATPLVNLVAVNDDLGGTSTSGFSYTLAGNVSYTFVTTAFSNTGVGTYVNTITPVPEPETYAMMALGLMLIGASSLRRRNRS